MRIHSTRVAQHHHLCKRPRPTCRHNHIVGHAKCAQALGGTALPGLHRKAGHSARPQGWSRCQINGVLERHTKRQFVSRLGTSSLDLMRSGMLANPALLPFFHSSKVGRSELAFSSTHSFGLGVGLRSYERPGLALSLWCPAQLVATGTNEESSQGRGMRHTIACDGGTSTLQQRDGHPARLSLHHFSIPIRGRPSISPLSPESPHLRPPIFSLTPVLGSQYPGPHSFGRARALNPANPRPWLGHPSPQKLLHIAESPGLFLQRKEQKSAKAPHEPNLPTNLYSYLSFLCTFRRKEK